MAWLEGMAVDEAAFGFASMLRQALHSVDAVGNIGPAQQWTTDFYVEHVIAQLEGTQAARPLLFTAPERGTAEAGYAHPLLLQGPVAALEHAATVRPQERFAAHWPQQELPDQPLLAKEYLQFFKCPQRAPPNVIDDRIVKLGCSEHDDKGCYSVPPGYRLLSMLAAPGTCDPHEVPDSSDLVLSPPNAVTRFHIDSGFVTLCELMCGEKLWAVCSLEDGIAHGLVNGRSPPSVAAFLRAPSAALVRVSAGQMILVPAGWFHFVVTEKPALGFSSNSLTLGGLECSRACVSTTAGRQACQLHADDFSCLEHTHRLGLKRHLAGAPKLTAQLKAAGASRGVRQRYAACLSRVPRVSP
jgi:hypothetical protein